ncbi:hypothetical protein NDU88_012163 [Pleurodeles waltl]|uniref:Uncharacterized protein n=1 Tax=Pleurodeles waltl TaxID=8319 RepID=A0AAV7R5E4_PLEWA|nr:hypothetical protein NDU88_012163 [Pleurodeles waltl]
MKSSVAHNCMLRMQGPLGAVGLREPGLELQKRYHLFSKWTKEKQQDALLKSGWKAVAGISAVAPGRRV